MINKILLTQILLSFSLISLSQTQERDPVVDRQFGWLQEVKAKPAERVGSAYLHDNWINGNVILKSNTEIKSVPIKLDLEHNIVELQTYTGIKIVDLSLLKQFNFDSLLTYGKFWNAQILGISGFTGIVEELATGKVSLYAKPYIEKLAPNYNAVMDVGERGDKLVKKERIFLVKDNEAIDITKSNKKILTYFGDKAEVLQAFAKQEDLSFKDKKDIKRIVEKFNSLL